MHIPIIDYIAINLDEEDTLDDNKNEIIDLDVDLPNMFSMHLMLTPTPNHRDPFESHSLDLAIVPTILDIAPFASYPPSPITNE